MASSESPEGGSHRPRPAVTPGGVITAAAIALSFAGAVWYGLCAVLLGGVLVWSVHDQGWRHPWGGPDAALSAWPGVLLATVTAVQVVILVLLIGGGVLLQRRRNRGRHAIMLACAVGFVLGVGWEWIDLTVSGPSGMLNLATLPIPFLVVLLVLVLVPPTRRWCQPGRGGETRAPKPPGRPH